ncbi:MAG: hypothetical protein AVDCRST_MAG11-628, partial [uncultured Gemmatimonadaceae bacterium]
VRRRPRAAGAALWRRAVRSAHAHGHRPDAGRLRRAGAAGAGAPRHARRPDPGPAL